MHLKKILSYFGFPYILYKTESDYNGEIIVSSVFGQNSISVENLTQSGPIVEQIWLVAVKKIKDQKTKVKKCLVLGVAGGSLIKILRKEYPDSKITGVEIDRKMVDVGIKYFDLKKYKTKIIIDDAFKFVQKQRKKYDLICVDLLIGRNVPKKLYSEKFFKNVRKILNERGVVVINQLRLKSRGYFQKEISPNEDLLKILIKIFAKIELKNPLVNTLIFCQ